MDLLCQDMRDACKESSEFAGSATFTVFGVLGRKEEVFWCLGSVFRWEAWPVGWGRFWTFCAFFGIRAFPHFVCVPLCFVCSQKVERMACTTFWGAFEAEKFQCVGILLSMWIERWCWTVLTFLFRSHGRTSTGNALLLVSNRVACVSKQSQNKEITEEMKQQHKCI